LARWKRIASKRQPESVTALRSPTMIFTSCAGGASQPVIEMRIPATRDGKPMVIQFLMVGVKPGTDKVLLLGFWSTPEANQARAPDMMQVVRDLVRP
jgi:hypothetical protein